MIITSQGSRCCKRSNVSRCVIASSVNTYVTIHRPRWLIKPSRSRLPSAVPHEVQSGQLSVRLNNTVWCIKDGHNTNVHFAFHCVTYNWESQKSWQIPRIWPCFIAVPDRVWVIPGSAVPSRNQVVAGYPSHFYLHSMKLFSTASNL